MTQWKHIILSVVAVVACTLAVVLLVTLTSATTAGIRAGTSRPAVPAHPQAEPVPDAGGYSGAGTFQVKGREPWRTLLKDLLESHAV
jgi:hypothetical protein